MLLTVTLLVPSQHMATSSFTFSEHLQDLCNIIVALDYTNPSDLSNFQLLIHQRAYRKLASRVSEFSTHWGRLPFDILSDHVDPKLPPKTFTFNSQRKGFAYPDFHYSGVWKPSEPEIRVSC